jgi:hypothetical protein
VDVFGCSDNARAMYLDRTHQSIALFALVPAVQVLERRSHLRAIPSNSDRTIAGTRVEIEGGVSSLAIAPEPSGKEGSERSRESSLEQEHGPCLANFQPEASCRIDPLFECRGRAALTV